MHGCTQKFKKQISNRIVEHYTMYIHYAVPINFSLYQTTLSVCMIVLFEGQMASLPILGHLVLFVWPSVLSPLTALLKRSKRELHSILILVYTSTGLTVV